MPVRSESGAQPARVVDPAVYVEFAGVAGTPGVLIQSKIASRKGAPMIQTGSR